MGKRHGLALAELLVATATLAIFAGLLLTACERRREESARIRCRNNLNQLAKGMATYLHYCGDDRFYPCPLGRGQEADTYNGAEWLAALYWTGVVPDPGVFLCPYSGDMNAYGKDLGSHRANDCGGTFGSQTVSYAGMWWMSVNTRIGGAIGADIPPNEVMASDDTQGGINHGQADNGGIYVLFFDSHVEFRTNTELDITSRTGSVGKKPGLLWRLKN